jgi:hypothetical protein
VEDVTTADPKQFMDLISILDAYKEDEDDGRLFVVKNGTKIIL